ncbi:MAG: hypothetical protein H0X18_14220 [Geodermatophilaceae bacterium]|nr:hypothetical protein [Geodermatophilaceae bacterium]
MTVNTGTDDNNAEAVEQGEPAPNDTDDRPVKAHNSEAAKYRTRLRQAEAERDAPL